MPGPAHDERHVRALLVGKILTSKAFAAVIAEEKHDRVLAELLAIEQCQDRADLAVQLVDRVEVRGPTLAGHRMVGQIGRQLHAGRIGRMVGRPFVNTVRFVQVHLGIKRLMAREAVPAVAVEGFWPGLEIPVGLAGRFETQRRWQLLDIGREISGLVQTIGN